MMGGKYKILLQKRWLNRGFIFNNQNRMSNFIETRDYLESPPLFEIQSKKILLPQTNKIRQRVWQMHTFTRPVSSRQQHPKHQNEQMQIFYDSLLEKEKNIARAQNSASIVNNFMGIRRRWKNSMSRGSSYNECGKISLLKSQLQKFFLDNDKKRDQIDMREIMRNMPKTVQLQKKYNSQVMIKYSSIHEAMQIDTQKRVKNSLNNRLFNSPVHSPIFSKMTKVLNSIPKEQTQNKNCLIGKEVKSLSRYKSKGKLMFKNKRLTAQI